MYFFVKFGLASSVKAASSVLRSILIQKMESLCFQLVWWNRLFRYFYTKTVSAEKWILSWRHSPPHHIHMAEPIWQSTRNDWNDPHLSNNNYSNHTSSFYRGSKTESSSNSVTINILHIESSGPLLGEHSWNTFRISLDAEWLIWYFHVFSKFVLKMRFWLSRSSLQHAKYCV